MRVQRQRLSARPLPPAPRLDVILSEAVLRRPLRNRTAMARQLRNLASADKRANVTVRVVPLAAGLHRWAAAGAFTILDFPAEGTRRPEPSTVYDDFPVGAIYLDKPHEVEVYDGIWRSLAGLALDETQSRKVIMSMAEEYDDDDQ